ncbi:MAG: NACHT domain-containing protein [Saprospiraceae bacterium]
MIAEALSGLPTEILGHYFGKIADFFGSELTDDLTWKKWKSEHGFASNNSDFPERYVETLVELKNQQKPTALQKFFAEQSVFGIIHEFWYDGKRGTDELPEAFNQLVRHFTLASQIKDFDAEGEVKNFLQIFTKSVYRNETAGGAEMLRLLNEIHASVKGASVHSAPNSDEPVRALPELTRFPILPSFEITVEKLWPQFYSIPKPDPYLPRKVSRVTVRAKKDEGSYFPQPETFDLLVEVRPGARIVLLGEAGMGKTTELDRICYELRASHEYFPIRRNLKNYDHLSTTPFFEIPQELKAWEDKVFIILDGLDETDMVSAQNAIGKIGTEHPKATILISCRKTAYAGLPGFNEYQLERLSSWDIRNYLQENLGGFSEQFLEYWAKRHPWEPDKLLENPFYLVRICDFFKENNWQLPNTIADIFEFLIEKSLKKRLDDAGRFGKGNRQDLRDSCRKSLKKLAFVMESMGENVISDSEFRKLIPDEKVQEVLCIKSSLLETAGGKWHFVHNNIQEYLAALALSKTAHFKVVKKIIGVKPDYRHLKHSWSNTLSFLLAVTGENSQLRADLQNWLMENEPAMLIKIGRYERERIGKAFRESAFKKEFKRCKKEDMFVGYRQYNYWEMAEFGESENNIRFLTNELGSEITPTVRNNALVLLKDMNPGLVPDDVKKDLRAQLLQIIYTPPENGTDVRHYAIEALSDLFNDLTDSEIEEIIGSFFDSKNAHVRTSVYALIEKRRLQTKYMTQLIHRTEELEDKTFREDTRLLDESWRLERCFESLESEDEFVCFFENYPIQIEHWHHRGGKLPVSRLLEKATTSTLSDKGASRILDAMKERFAEWLWYQRDVEGRMVIPFVKKYQLGFRLFQYCIEKQGIPSVEAQLLDDECLEYLIERFDGGNLKREYVQNLINWVAHQNKSMLKPLLIRLNEVASVPFTLPEIAPPVDFKKKKIEDLQREKEMLFKKEKLLAAIEGIFSEFGVTQFEKGEIYDYNRKRRNGLPLYENYPLRLSRIIDEDTPTTKDEIVEKLTQNWEWVFVREIRQYLITHKSDIDENSELDLTPEEILNVEKWCKSHYPKMDLDKNVTWGDVTFVFFLLRYGFNGYPDKLYLDLVGHGFQYHIGSELDIFDFILSNLPHLKSQLEIRVIENLKIGKAKGYEFTNHLQFVRSQKLVAALPVLRNYTEGKVELDSHDKRLVLEIAIELGESAAYLKNLLREIEDHQEERRESVLLNHFLKNPDPEIEQILLQKLAKASENQLRYARYLVGLGNIKGLRFFSEFARKEKKSPFQYDDFTNRNLVFENPDAIWEVIRLLDLGHDKTILQDNFDSITYAAQNMLSHIANMQDGLFYAKVHRAISRCLLWHSWLNKLPSWLRKRIWVARPETLKTLRYLLSDLEIKHFHKQKIEFSEAVALWERLEKSSKR